MVEVDSIPHGVGLAWRPGTAWTLQRRDDLVFSEVIAESVEPHKLPPALHELVARGTPVVPHGISLGLGGAHPVDLARLDHLARLAEALSAPFVSEHVAFVRADGLEAGHLLPVPRTRECLDVVVENVRTAIENLPVPLVLENIATLVDWPDSELTEGEFLAELLAQTDALLLLDMANLFANQENHGWDTEAFLNALPLERVAYVHVAGGRWKHGLYHDTHSDPLAGGPLGALERLFARGDFPVLLEMDAHFGTRAELDAELDAIAAAIARGRVSRAPRHPAGREVRDVA